MEDCATKLTAALDERRTAATAKLTLTPLPEDLTCLYLASNRTPRLRVPGASSFEESDHPTPTSGVHTPHESDFVYHPSEFQNRRPEYSFTPVPGPDFAQLFQPEFKQADGRYPPRTKYHKPFSMYDAMRRGVFVERLENSSPVATPSTVASSWNSAASTPVTKGPWALRTFGESRTRAQAEGANVDEELSAVEESCGGGVVSEDEQSCSDGAVPEDEGLTSDEESGSNDESDGDEEMTNSEEFSEDEEMSEHSE